MRDNVSGNSPTYHPSYEFPGGDTSVHTYAGPTATPSNDFPICRLVIRQSRFISKQRRLAVIDGYSEVQFGRDAVPPGASTPRIRLKDMEVSKLHATLFWDAERAEWAVVDMGSKHGTFVASGQDANRVRLSATRVASMPKRMRHLDRLSLGGTTFVVHIHENRLPCSDCSASGQGTDDLIPLFSHQGDSETVAQAERSRKRGADPAGGVPRNAKRALASLRHNLLSRPGGFFPAASPPDGPAHPSNDGAVQRGTPDTTGPPLGKHSSPSPRVMGEGSASPSRESSHFVPIVYPEWMGLPTKSSEEGGIASEPASNDDREK